MKATRKQTGVATWLAITLLLVTIKLTIARPEVIEVKHGAVASDDERCSIIGRNVLKDHHGKGNAVDAAVATALCLGVVGQGSSGIGGGSFMVVRLANGTLTGFDMREVAPMNADPQVYASNPKLKEKGPFSIGVPGELKGLHAAWKQFGKLPWKRLVHPAAELARKFKISSFIFEQLVIVESDVFADKGMRELYTSHGRLLQIGDFCHNTKLAETLHNISIYGIEPFYNGSIGQNIIADIQEKGGNMTMADLQNYEVKIRTPFTIDLPKLGLTLHGMPPPAGGVGVALMLNILAGYDLPKGVSGPIGTHRVAEAIKHVFAIKANLGDPAFTNISDVVSDMLNTSFAADLRGQIYDYMTFNLNHYGGKWNQKHFNPNHEHGTSHISIIDNDGNAVGITTTVNYHFGSRILSPSTGILLNNQLDDFTQPGNGIIQLQSLGTANFIAPGKRPQSSMSPTIILQNKTILKAVVGACGGPTIISGVAEIIINKLFKGMDGLSTIMAPRVYHTWWPNVLQTENLITIAGDHIAVPDGVISSLRSKGHVIDEVPDGCVINLITVNHTGIKVLEAVGDPRKGGIPAGY